MGFWWWRRLQTKWTRWSSCMRPCSHATRLWWWVLQVEARVSSWTLLLDLKQRWSFQPNSLLSIPRLNPQASSMDLWVCIVWVLDHVLISGQKGGDYLSRINLKFHIAPVKKINCKCWMHALCRSVIFFSSFIISFRHVRGGRPGLWFADPDTRDWTDGLLSCIFREINKPLPPDRENER